MNIDFNNADTQFDGPSDFELIPDGEYVTLVSSIRPGGIGDGGWLTQGQPSASSSGGWQFISFEFVILGGTYDKRKVWQNVMFDCVGPTDPQKAEKTTNISKSLIRAMLESARNVHPTDESEDAIQKRQIKGLEDLNGLQFRARLRIEKSKDPQYEDKNQIKVIVTPDMDGYKDSDVVVELKVGTFQHGQNKKKG
jgi:hypothetical protein